MNQLTVIRGQRLGLLRSQCRLQEAENRGHVPSGRVQHTLSGNGEENQDGQVQHQRRIGTVGQLLEQTVLVAKN